MQDDKEAGMTHKECKAHIRRFMQAHYDDAHLAALLAHAQDGELVFCSSDCFIGACTANHALRGVELQSDFYPEVYRHYYVAKRFLGGKEAEEAYFDLGKSDTERCRRLVPMIRAEFRRRERVRKAGVVVGQMEERVPWALGQPA